MIGNCLRLFTMLFLTPIFSLIFPNKVLLTGPAAIRPMIDAYDFDVLLENYKTGRPQEHIVALEVKTILTSLWKS